VDEVLAQALQDACSIGLAIAGHFAPDSPDAWLRQHETRLREFEQYARRALKGQAKGGAGG
jgi:hypothetical protein